MANEILFGNCDKHIIKVRVRELNRGPQGPQGPKGDDGAIQYTAGTGINISDDNVISATSTGGTWGTITGTLSNQTDLNTALASKASTTAVQTAQNTANSAANTANSANTAATNANNAIEALGDYLNLNNVTLYNQASQYQITSGGGTIYSANLRVATNSTNSVCSIWGEVTVVNSNGSGNEAVKLNVDTGLHPDEAITLNLNGIVQPDEGTYGGVLSSTYTTINPDGTLMIRGYHNAGTTLLFRVFATLTFLKSFAETQQS